MTNRIVIPVSLTIMVAAPALIAGQIGTETTSDSAAPPKPIASSLTVEAEGDEATTLLSVQAVGPPPSTSATLASDDGLESATVGPAADCDGAPERQVALAGDQQPTDWCLEISGLPNHGEVKGSISGDAGDPATEETTDLALTVHRRHAFVGGPLGALAGSLVVALGVALFMPWYRTGVGLSRLSVLERRNARAPRSSQIGGLSEWVAARTAADSAASELLRLLEPVVENGPTEAREARNQLRKALREHPLPTESPLGKSAREEGDRRDNVIGDFLKEDGTPAVHPATALEGAVISMGELETKIDLAEQDMRERLQESCWPKKKLSAARLAWGRVATSEEVASVVPALAALRTAVDEKQGLSECLKPGAEALTGDDKERAYTGLRTASPLELGTAALHLGGWALLTGAAIAVALGVAGVAVGVEAYDAKPGFGSWQDYFALISAGLASGAAATVIALLAPWGSAPADSE